MEKLLEIKDLHISFFSSGARLRAVNGISYDVHRGEVVGIVGESGCGKSAQAYSILGLLRGTGRVTGGSIAFRGEDVLSYSRAEYEAFRGAKTSMIFQNPMSCLNPVFTIGNQLAEALRCHESVSPRDARARASEMLRAVGIADAERRMSQYPHELSGGMRQRVMIAMALMCSPELLIADEPTTALDVTIQAQIIDLLKNLRAATGMAIIFITHNFGVVAEICDRVCVMYAGHIVEQGTADDVFYSSAHPYTRALLEAIPRVDFGAYKRLVPIEGSPLDITRPPTGCPFNPRCRHCMQVCREKLPPYTVLGDGHQAMCWLLSDAQAKEVSADA